MIIHLDAAGKEIARYPGWAEYNDAALRRAEVIRQDGDSFVIRDRQAPWVSDV